MFIYLSKKIAIPHNIQLKSVAWNSEQGWIACGGGKGLLKVLKLESKKNNKGVAVGPSNLSMNQTLEGHNGSVCVVTWNENYRKLTTSDQYGLIIVWMLHKQMWFEEMINNRNKSVVRDMKWTGDGQKICIVYEDGAVIVGSVDGNRLWGQDLDINLALVEWSPDGRNILFGTTNGEVHVYDNMGSFVSRVSLYASSPGSGAQLVGLQWYNGVHGYVEPNVPTLAICFDNGKVQIMRDTYDDVPVLIDTGIQTHKMRWNTTGSVLAIAGRKMIDYMGDSKETQMVQFYSPFGKHLRTLKVPGSGINSISWEGGSLRLALAVDSFIYFANIRPDYEWGYFSNTLVYSFNKPNRSENCVAFWDTSTDERHIKYVKQLISIRAAGEHCVFATRTEDASGEFILILCNAIGSPVDSKYINVEPVHVAMTPNHVIVASNELVYVWQYHSAVARSYGKSSFLGRKAGREKFFHIDDSPNKDPKTMLRTITNDPICAITASTNTLVIGRASGTLMRYSLPHISLENKYVVRCRPQLLSLNADSSRLSIIDINGMFTIFDLDAQTPGTKGPIGKHLDFERKDAWDMKWSDDNPDLFAVMEKTRMYVFRGLRPEEPVMSNGYLCSFSDLCIKAVLMDNVMAEPEQPTKNSVVNFETKSLRDTRELLDSVPTSEAFQFVEDNPHPRLWRLLAETALEQLNFDIADKAFVRCSDYQGIQFVKRLKLLQEPHKRNKQKAEVAAYFKRFDEAETIYIDMDQKDLAIELRMRLGDWLRVVQLIQSGAGDDKLLTKAYNNIGDYYSDRQKWIKAYKYYKKANNLQEQVNCAYMLDDYKNLEALVEEIPPGSDFLHNVADKFMSVGLCAEAVTAFLKADDAKAAIDCCVLLNQWDQAVQLAEQYDFNQIETLLSKYASQMLEKNKLFQAVELYRKANRHTEAAKLLGQLAQKAAETGVDPLLAKKLYVLAALEVDSFKARTFDNQLTYGASSTEATLKSLMDHDAATGANKHLEDPWHGAEAYHFYLLAQRQLYLGLPGPAMITAIRLTDYEDILPVKDIFSLIALTSFYNKFYNQCSRAFIKLESMDTLTKEEREKYKKLALEIFIRNSPEDPSSRSFPCPNTGRCSAQVKEWHTACPECGKSIPACIETGRAIFPGTAVTICRICKHKSYESDTTHTNCALCHSPRQSQSSASDLQMRPNYDSDDDDDDDDMGISRRRF